MGYIHGNRWLTIFNPDDHFSVVCEGARLVCNDVPLIKATEDREKGGQSRHDGVLSQKRAAQKTFIKVGKVVAQRGKGCLKAKERDLVMT
jgi:hypothetical protein